MNGFKIKTQQNDPGQRRTWRLFWLSLIGLAVAAALLFIVSMPALANQVVGDGTPASCTGPALQSAVSVGGLVTFNCGQSAESPVTIPITQTIQITKLVTIDGGNKAQIILHGGDSGSGQPSGISLIQVAPGIQAELRQITLTRAGSSSIRNAGSLILDGVEIYYARAQACAGVESSSSLITRNNTLISSNTAETNGGGLCVLAGTASLERTSIEFNIAQNGGGLFIGGGTVSDQDSFYASNLASSAGGGIFVGPGAVFKMNASASALNQAGSTAGSAGGGLFNQGETSLYSAVITENGAYDGGGVANSGSLSVEYSNILVNQADLSSGRGGGLFNQGLVTYTGSSLVKNKAANGAGFYNTGDLTLTNTTLSQNAASLGGSMSAAGQMHLRYTTLVENTPQDLLLFNAHADILGSIVASCTLSGGSLDSLGYNLDSGSSCGLTLPSDQSQTNPQLGPLTAVDGRLTWHHMPADTSPALDGGESTCPDTQHQDQHQAVRPAGAACDIGAVEAGGVIPTATPTLQPTNTPTPGPTSTPTASPTPGEYLIITPTATPAGPYTFPAPAGTTPISLTLQLSSAQGRPGDRITASGSGAQDSVRLTWTTEQVTFNGIDAAAAVTGDYLTTLTVPDGYGDIKICAASGDTDQARFVCAAFFINHPQDSGLIINLPDALPASATVNLVDHAGNIVYSAQGQNSTSVSISGISTGAYHVAIAGATTSVYHLSQVRLAPGVVGAMDLEKMKDVLDPISGGICQKNAAVGLVQAKFSYDGFYTGRDVTADPIARQGSMVMEATWINQNFTYLAPQAEFGTFISGVALFNEFLPKLSGSTSQVQAVQYWVRGAGQSQWTNIGTSGAAPFKLRYNVGLLPPGKAEMLVAPVVNNNRQCGHILKINMVPNPMAADYMRQNITIWNESTQTYRFTALMPELAFLPLAYQSDPWKWNRWGISPPPWMRMSKSAAGSN